MIALGEHAELETQATIGYRRSFINGANMEAFEKLSQTVGQLAHGLVRSLQARMGDLGARRWPPRKTN